MQDHEHMDEASNLLDRIVLEYERRFHYVRKFDTSGVEVAPLYVDGRTRHFTFKALTHNGVRQEGVGCDTRCSCPLYAVEMYRRALYDFVRSRLGGDGRGKGTVLGWRERPALEFDVQRPVDIRPTALCDPTAFDMRHFIVYSRLEVWREN